MKPLPYDLVPDDPTAPPLGLIVLQSDETLEPEFHHHFADHRSPLYVSRIPSGETVTGDSLRAMERDLPSAARLLPQANPFAVVGYGCTSASSLIGATQVADLVLSGCNAAHVTNPLSATAAVASRMGVSKFALVSPYIEEVNEPLRAAFAASGLSTDVFGSFSVAEEASVVRISEAAIVDAGIALGSDPNVEAVFLSCTNLRTVAAIPVIEKTLGKPVLSSNLALATHMKWLCDAHISEQMTVD